jgi:hypothetical protein
MKTKSKAQELRLVIDNLEHTAVQAAGAVKDLPEMAGKSGALLPKTPEGIHSLAGVLRKAYEGARDTYNEPTAAELKFLTQLDPAKRALHEARGLLVKAQAAFDTAVEGHEHRIRLEDPTINVETGVAVYVEHPTCLLCGEHLKHEWFCIKSPEIQCRYPNVLGKGAAHLITGTDLFEADHAGDIECIHCGETWMRVR